MTETSRKKRILLFGTGGGSGVTRFLADSAVEHKRLGNFEPMVAYRRKRRPIGRQFIDTLEQSQIPWREVRAAPKVVTIAQLRRILREFRPDVFLVHGHSDHIWGRMAAIRENVPVVVMVEANLERYRFLERWRSVRLAARTDAIVAVSDGVGRRLIELGHPADKLHVIHNGAPLERFRAAAAVPLDEREPAVLMAARFARQKDHATLIRAAALLRDRGRPIRVRLAGTGSARHEGRARRLVRRLGLEEWVEFLGPRSDIPDLLGRHRVFVISTHYEGLCIAGVEAMAAGCATIGTRTVGVTDLFGGEPRGWLVEPRDPVGLADAIVEALGPEGAVRAAAGHRYAMEHFSMTRAITAYEQLFVSLLAGRPKEHVRERG
ncbi:MAG: glycosyltransferase [Verrucomicrobia bacterium]|nr:MAG: glycosyltransferase [Verrucomicrobiota bacterium]